MVASALLLQLRFEDRATEDFAALWTQVPEYPSDAPVYADGRVRLTFDHVGGIPSLHDPWRGARVSKYGCDAQFLTQAFGRTQNVDEFTSKADGARVTCEARAVLREGLRKTYKVEIDTVELVYEGPLVTPDTEGESSPDEWRVVSLARQSMRRGGHPASFFLRASFGGGFFDDRYLSSLEQQIGFRLGRTPFPLLVAWAPHLDLSVSARQIGFGAEDAGAQVELGGQIGVGLRRVNGKNALGGLTVWTRLGRAMNDRFDIAPGAAFRTVGFDSLFGSAGGANGRGFSLIASVSASRVGGRGLLGDDQAITTGLTAGFGIAFDGYFARVEEIHKGALERP